MDPLDEFEQCWSGLGLDLLWSWSCLGLNTSKSWSCLGLNVQLSWSRLGLGLGGLDYNTTVPILMEGTVLSGFCHFGLVLFMVL